MQKPKVDPEFRSFIPPLSESERADLERAIAAAGRAIDPILVWRGLVVDGHNRLEICMRLGLPFETRELEIPDRDAVKAWMFEHQIARRNLSPDQLLILAALRGLTYERGTARQKEMAAYVAARAPERAAAVLAGRYSLALAYGALQPRKPRAPRPPQGPLTAPITPHVPEGLEVSGVTTHTNAKGEVDGQHVIARRAGNADPEPPPPDFAIKRVHTMTRGDGSEIIRNVTYDRDEAERAQAIADAWARHASVYAGLAGTAPAPVSTREDLCSLYPLGDPHIGMLAWAPETGTHWDLTIATQTFMACIRELVASAPPSERAIITNLGDFLHAQDDANVTPGHGNKLDVDGRFAKVLDAGHALLRGIIDEALRKHRHVTVRNLPGNHDPRVAAELSMWLRAVYEKEPRVTVADAFRAHQYDRFGSTLVGWHHGDRTPAKELPAIMATDMAREWGETLFHVWHTGHVHHESSKEYPGCDVESHGILPPGDAWHAGRYRSRRRMSVITLHKDFGEIARATVGIERVRAAMKGETLEREAA
jgi:hypothetical protein